ncbi:MAG TPA: carboxypeptidase-like regulatory domain-containing protein [Chthonomonadaceae bacterium]|nr:carboxypeptidase-like regulatory domain-containing protein [Chthonomonadaceae bacterium]
MRQSVLPKSSHIRFSLVLILSLMFALALSACGGGGGGGGNNFNQGGGNGGVVVTGTVTDPNGNPIKGAVVSIVGTNLSTTTAADGTFTISNVPAGASEFVVTSPNLNQYADLAEYKSFWYPTDPLNSYGQCKMPLPSPLHIGFNSIGLIYLYNLSAGTPPPPPATSCPPG